MPFLFSSIVHRIQPPLPVGRYSPQIDQIVLFSNIEDKGEDVKCLSYEPARSSV